MAEPDDETLAPRGPFHYAMQRVLGPAMGLLIFVVMLVVFPVLIAGGSPPFTTPHLIALFALFCAGFWAWARRLDAKREKGK